MVPLPDIENTGGRPGLGQKDNEFCFKHIKYEAHMVPIGSDVPFIVKYTSLKQR